MGVFTEKFHAKIIFVAIFFIYGKTLVLQKKMFITLAPVPSPGRPCASTSRITASLKKLVHSDPIIWSTENSKIWFNSFSARLLYRPSLGSRYPVKGAGWITGLTRYLAAG